MKDINNNTNRKAFVWLIWLRISHFQPANIQDKNKKYFSEIKQNKISKLTD